MRVSRSQIGNTVDLGIYSFGDIGIDPTTGVALSVATVLDQTLERIQLAEQVGLAFYGVGEHHLDRYAISNPGTVLAAAAALTKQIILSSAVTVLSTEDPVRLFQQFTTLDQLSHGRAELLAGRGSFTESFPLFGADLDRYDDLYAEKLDLLLRLNKAGPVNWTGQFRPALNDAVVLPRPFNDSLRVSVATGGNPSSSARAGALGLPVVYAIIGGQPERFAPLVNLYRQSSLNAGHRPEAQDVTFSGVGMIADDSQTAKDEFYPYWNRMMQYGAEARGWSVPSRRDYDSYTDGARDLLVGDPQEIASRIVAISKLVGARRYALQFDWAGVPHQTVMRAIELFGTVVRPLVEAGLASS